MQATTKDLLPNSFFLPGHHKIGPRLHRHGIGDSIIVCFVIQHRIPSALGKKLVKSWSCEEAASVGHEFRMGTMSEIRSEVFRRSECYLCVDRYFCCMSGSDVGNDLVPSLSALVSKGRRCLTLRRGYTTAASAGHLRAHGGGVFAPSRKALPHRKRRPCTAGFESRRDPRAW